MFEKEKVEVQAKRAKNLVKMLEMQKVILDWMETGVTDKGDLKLKFPRKEKAQETFRNSLFEITPGEIIIKDVGNISEVLNIVYMKIGDYIHILKNTLRYDLEQAGV